MTGTVVLDRQETERGEIVLRRREGADGRPLYEIISNGCFLMASTNAHSAAALARLGLEGLGERTGLRLLIAGLGIGYTLQAALELPNVAQVEVVEIEPLIVRWAGEYFAPVNGNALADPRVRLTVDDLLHYLSMTSGPYDAILLDIDNGPRWLVFEENAPVYDLPALQRMRDLLAPGGVLAVWAAERSPHFLATLRHLFPWANEQRVVEEVEGRLTEYFIYRARREPAVALGG